jgi:hypothetical protein
VGDERHLEAEQRIEGALHAARGEAQRFADARQAVHGGALRRDVGHFAQLAERHGNAVVAADHGEAGGPAIHFLGLFDQRKAPDHFFAEFRPGMQIERDRQLAPFRQLLLAVEFLFEKAHALFQDLAQLRIALQQEMNGFLRNHQQRRIGQRHRGRHLLLAHQAGFLAEYLALPQRRQRIVGALFAARQPDLAVADDVQPAVLAAILPQDFLAGGHALDADAAHELFQLAPADLAAQVEQLRDEAAGRADRDITGHVLLRRAVLCDQRNDGFARDEQQFGLQRRAHRRFMPVIAQHGDVGEDFAGLAHAHADFLAALLGENPDRSRLDDEQAAGRIAGIAHGVAEGIETRFGLLGQALDFFRRKRREDFHR